MPKILGGASGMHVVRAGFIALYVEVLITTLPPHDTLLQLIFHIVCLKKLTRGEGTSIIVRTLDYVYSSD